MASKIRDFIGQNLRHPDGLAGSLISSLVFDKNAYLEQNAARLCRIQPHHKVLEIGFGPGHGLKEAYQYVKDGTGMIYGVDYSQLMVNKARRKMKHEITAGKVDISLGTVVQLPFNTDMFDSVFHCNCYYFWPDMKMAVQELYRVMKPGATMVTTMDVDRVRKATEKGYMKNGQPDPVNFLWALEEYGFEDVNFEYMSDGERKFEAIFARINEKQAYDEDFEEEVASVVDGSKTSVDKETGHIKPSIS